MYKSIDGPAEGGGGLVGHLSRDFRRFLTEVVYHSATIQTLDWIFFLGSEGGRTESVKIKPIKMASLKTRRTGRDFTDGRQTLLK